MRHYQNYTDEDIIKFAAEVFSMAQLLAKLGIKPVGGNYATMKKRLQRLELECEHWTGKAWNRGERLKDWNNYARPSSVKKHIILDRGHSCEDCGNSTWKDKPIPLEIHHVDGNKTNNNLENLQLLCCNCHALTPNWRNKDENRKNQPINQRPKDECPCCGEKKLKRSSLCGACDKEKRSTGAKKSKVHIVDTCQCGKDKLTSSQLCRDCYQNTPRVKKINWPSIEEMSKLVFQMPTSKLSEKLGVSDSSIGKFCKRNGIKKPSFGYWLKPENRSPDERI